MVNNIFMELSVRLELTTIVYKTIALPVKLRKHICCRPVRESNPSNPWPSRKSHHYDILTAMCPSTEHIQELHAELLNTDTKLSVTATISETFSTLDR